jgi:cellulose synthase/poly-beta-1,6-N-acetylglucosamine synthase-like glycosyltransferase
MLASLKVAFWASVAIVVYAYAGYGACVALLARLRPRPPRAGDITPIVSFIIPCHNEAGWIAEKLENTLALDYPSENLEILVVADGCDDGTETLVERFADRGVRCLVQPVRAGKEAAMQFAAREARGDVLLFTDANARLNMGALRAMTRWFADPDVGCVAGEKRVVTATSSGKQSGEGAYWRYESMLKRLDSQVGSTMGGTGELIAIRADLMSVREADNIIEDFVLSMRVVEAGYRVVYEPSAIAEEEEPAQIENQFERRARIAAGGFQAMMRLAPLLDPRRGTVWWQYVSHRVLRWALVPFLLPLVVIINGVLARGRPLYQATFAAQVAFYAAAAVGWWRRDDKVGKLPCFYFPFYFCAANAAAIVGCARLLSKRQTVLWKRTRP